MHYLAYFNVLVFTGPQVLYCRKSLRSLIFCSVYFLGVKALRGDSGLSEIVINFQVDAPIYSLEGTHMKTFLSF